MSGQPWQSGWYGHAKHRPMQTHSAKQWETAVGGTRTTMRAIYGSTDNAVLDHRNDTLCVVVDDDKGMRDGKAFVPYTTGRHTDVVTTVIDIDNLIRRATALKVSIVEYCNMMGLPTP